MSAKKLLTRSSNGVIFGIEHETAESRKGCHRMIEGGFSLWMLRNLPRNRWK